MWFISVLLFCIVQARIFEIRFTDELALGVSPGNVTVVSLGLLAQVKNITRSYLADKEYQRIKWRSLPGGEIVAFTNPNAYLSIINPQKFVGLASNAIRIHLEDVYSADPTKLPPLCFMVLNCDRRREECDGEASYIHRGLFIKIVRCRPSLKYSYEFVFDETTDSPVVTMQPSTRPSTHPITIIPTFQPTSTQPSTSPTSSPGISPTTNPSTSPISSPGISPTTNPSTSPTSSPWSVLPTASPTTSMPSTSPTASPETDDLLDLTMEMTSLSNTGTSGTSQIIVNPELWASLIVAGVVGFAFILLVQKHKEWKRQQGR